MSARLLHGNMMLRPWRRLAILALGLGIIKVTAVRQLPSLEAREGPVAGGTATAGATADTVRLVAVGDLMCHTSQLDDARTTTGFDFRPAFAPVRPYLSRADLAIGNLETVTAGPEERFTGYPQFNCPVEYLDAIGDAGFDVITTANNHSLDRRFLGVERTIQALEDRGLRHTGTARTAEERDRPLIAEVKGMRIAVLAYTYGTNGIALPAGKPFAVNLIDTLAMARDIRQARAASADAIIVSLHWGTEYERQPNIVQRRVATFLAGQGVEVILGSHPHVLQPLEWLPGLAGRTLVIYSLGNFFSGQRKRYTDSGLILGLSLIRDGVGQPVRVDAVQVVPTYVARRPSYRIVAVTDALEAMVRGDTTDPHAARTESGRVREVWMETIAHLVDSSAGITVAPRLPR
ncbi:MAG: CapA family protein [Planctomycetaceae bacterium]